MDDRCIAVLDSGIGGVITLKKLKEKYPNENFVYFADLKNFPYGNKSEKELKDIAFSNYKRLLSFGVKVVVFACNTLSVTAEECFTNSPVPVIGVKPIARKQGKGLLICTPKTANSVYVQQLKKDADLTVLPQDGLADEIELSFEGKPIDLKKRFLGVSRDYDYLSLGCTHYPFLTKEFEKIFPKSRIISGEELIFDKFNKIVTTANPNRKNGIVLFVGDGRKKAEQLFNRIF
ncbi:MAG: hypothetical protein E7360_04045 [Clostridiales bacterium]|nr:hypothetical protein [Clostridiales bacterium]